MHWRSLGGALKDLDLTGHPDSGGVWAPSLSHAGGRFHLLFGRHRGDPLGPGRRAPDRGAGAAGPATFTGAFAGLWVWDLSGHGHPAGFLLLSHG